MKINRSILIEIYNANSDNWMEYAEIPLDEYWKMQMMDSLVAVESSKNFKIDDNSKDLRITLKAIHKKDPSMRKMQYDFLGHMDKIESASYWPDRPIYADTAQERRELLMVASLCHTMGVTWDHPELIKRIVLRPPKGDSNEMDKGMDKRKR